MSDEKPVVIRVVTSVEQKHGQLEVQYATLSLPAGTRIISSETKLFRFDATIT